MSKSGIILTAAALVLAARSGSAQRLMPEDDSHDHLQRMIEQKIDSLFLINSLCFTLPRMFLDEDDLADAARRLGVEVAAIKAVVEIEAGKSLSGFTCDSIPVVNFSPTVFAKKAERNGINVPRARKAHPAAFAPLDRQKYGSVGAAQFARLKEAMAVDTAAAVESTFWGMFQIGGFNYRRCGEASHRDFAERMMRSEHDQLALFIHFLENNGMVEAIRKKNWAEFARMYNGPSYRRRSYHTRLAAAYKKYSQAQDN